MQEHGYFGSFPSRNMLGMHYRADISGHEPNQLARSPLTPYREPNTEIRGSSSVIPKTQHA